jgi:hypothetical protein
MEYGTFVGVCWGALFLCYVEGISYQNGLLILLCLALFGVAFCMPFVLGMRLNRKLFFAGERLSYWQGLLFAFSMFMYASMLNGLIVYAYFQFLDDGLLMEQINSMVNMPEMVTAYQQLGMGEQYEQMTSMLREMDELTAFEKALLVFNNNFFISIFMSFLVAFVASYDLRKIHKQ